jgi:hypothetical protein
MKTKQLTEAEKQRACDRQVERDSYNRKHPVGWAQTDERILNAKAKARGPAHLPSDAPDWFGCGRIITTESWESFKKARADYYRRVDEAKAAGAPNDPLLGHPHPISGV